MLRGLLHAVKRAPVLCTAGVVAGGYVIAHLHSQHQPKQQSAGELGRLSSVVLSLPHLSNTNGKAYDVEVSMGGGGSYALLNLLPVRLCRIAGRISQCDSIPCPTVCVVTEIPQGSAIFLTGHGDQDINQAESGADPFIFQFTRGYIPQTRVSREEPLCAIVLGHLESVPGWMLKDATVVGQLVVVEQNTGVQLSKDLVVVGSESNLTREQIEDLMTEAATCLETLKSEYELGAKVYVQPVYDPTVAAQTLLQAKLEYGKQQEAEHKLDMPFKPPKTMEQKRRESKQAKEMLDAMPLSDVPLSNLFEELARRGINSDPSEGAELRQMPNPR